MSNLLALQTIQTDLLPHRAVLVAVSKNHLAEEVMPLYEASQRVFGENRVQELLTKYEQLPKDIEWHLIGHLQTNKVKLIAPFISLIHSVDSEKLLAVINNEAQKCNRVIDCLLQVHIASEDTKFGFSLLEAELFIKSFAPDKFPNIRLRGLMGMATFTEDSLQIEREFNTLADLFKQVQKDKVSLQPHFNILSMGMSSDYRIALQCGSNMVRIGSLLF